MAITKEINIVVKETGIDGLNKKIDQLEDSLGDVSKTNKNLNKNLDETKGKGNVFGNMTDGASKLSPAIGGAISGMKSMLSTMWLIVANPLGAILVAVVGALTILYKAFVSTNAGADKLNQIMAGVSATIDVVRDRVLKVGEALTKFFSGDFSGAIKVGREAVEGFGDEVEKEFRQAAEATRFLQDVADATRDLGVSRAKLNRDLARSKEIITDETASYADKKKAIDEVRVAEEKQTALELANAKKKLKSIQDLNKLSDTSDEDLQKEADAQEALYALEEKSASDKRAIRKTELRARNEEASRIKEINDGIAQKAKEANERQIESSKKRFENEKNFVDAQLKNEKLSIDEKRNIVLASQELSKEDQQKFLLDLHNQEIEAEKQHQKNITDLNKKYDDEKAQRLADTAVKKEELDYENKVKEIEALITDKTERDAILEKLNEEHLIRMGAAKKTDREKELEEEKKFNENLLQAEESLKTAKLNAANFTTQLITQLAGKNKAVAMAMLAIEKGLAIAQIVSGAGKAIANASANLAAVPAVIGVVPNPMYAVQAAATVKGIAATKISAATSIASILAQTITSAKGLSGGGGSAGGGGGSAPQAPSFNLVEGTGRNQIAESIGKQAPVKAFVVARDMSTGQEMDRNIIKSASL